MMKKGFGMIGRVSAWGAVVAGAVLAAGFTLSGAADAGVAAAPACPSCGHNLILNPGADAGKGTSNDSVVKVPHWKGTHGFTAATYAWGKSGGGDLSPTSPGPKNRGANYFYGGPDSAVSTGTQEISVAAGGIKTGKVHYTLAGWLGGFSGQGDYAVLDLTFENSKGKAIASYGIGPVTEAQRGGVSELLFRHRTGVVPSGTRELKVELIMTREEGSDDDGLADSLSLVFTDKK
jgi:hypothetical protein